MATAFDEDGGLRVFVAAGTLKLDAFSFKLPLVAEMRVIEDTEEPPEVGLGGASLLDEPDEATDRATGGAALLTAPLATARGADDDDDAADPTFFIPPPLLPEATAFPPFPFARTAIGSYPSRVFIILDV